MAIPGETVVKFNREYHGVQPIQALGPTTYNLDTMVITEVTTRDVSETGSVPKEA